MATDDPVRALGATLEATRLKAIEAMATGGTPSPDALRELSTLQTALTAVRESIKEHGIGLGWGGGEEELDEPALDLPSKK